MPIGPTDFFIWGIPIFVGLVLSMLFLPHKGVNLAVKVAAGTGIVAFCIAAWWFYLGILQFPAFG